MKLAELAAEPKLIQITLDDSDIVEKYGEALEFGVMDRQPIDHYMKMARMGEDNIEQIGAVVTDMVLDEEGEKVLKGNLTLPAVVTMKVFTKVIETLGK
jgi:hypothetical protein